jgi:DNA-binding transcriptional MocR family regulator
MFIQIDRAAHLPIYLQIEDTLRRLIAQGTLRPGDRLPSTRQLAAQVGVNRITIEAAFSKLEADGLINSHVGRGTFVNRVSPPPGMRSVDASPDAESLARLWGPLFVDLRPAPMSLPALNVRLAGKAISFVHAAPASDLFPGAEFRRCVDYVLKRRVHEVAGLGSSDGLPSLRSQLVRWFAQSGIEASEDEVITTTGCQQSMDLIRRILVGPGDALMMENPTYPGAVAALAPSSSERLELPINEGGPDLRVLTSLGGRNICRLIYVVPNFHNPTGLSMSLDSRRQLVTTTSELRIPVVEDDVFGELRYTGPALPSLKSLCPHLVIYIGSFSKMLSPSLRLGWIIAPRPVARRLNAVKQACDLHTNLLVQAAMDEFCRRDLLHRHLKRIRRVFLKRRDAMAEAVHREFPSDARWELPKGGLSFWVSLHPECDTEELLRLAQEQGVQFLPGSAFYFRSPLYNSLRLSFAAESEERIREGIRILGRLLASQKSRPLCNAAWAERPRPRPAIM